MPNRPLYDYLTPRFGTPISTRRHSTRASPIDADLLRIPVGPGAMHVERYGHGGAPAVLIHGFGTCSFLWRNVAPALALTQHTAYAVDLLGYGESDRPFDADFGLAAQADYLERALTALRVARAALVGVDIGAAIALRLAWLRPERVARLVLINPIGGEDIPGGDIRAMQRNTARFALRVSRGLFGASALLTPILTQSVADPARMPPMLIGRYLAPFIGQEGVTHLLALARAVRPTDLEDVDPAQVRAHTLIVRGEKDMWVDGAVSRKLAADITDCRVVSFPDAARLIPEDAPEELAALISSFISPHVGPANAPAEGLPENAMENIAEDAGTPEGGLA
ncbi:MAG TPA: alpha/beta fold hydrolase [Gemmatimonadaceae bacterium]|nr:alpha/beta fold hydrolase [Gemmatimonadaceae bacterium]